MSGGRRIGCSRGMMGCWWRCTEREESVGSH